MRFLSSRGGRPASRPVLAVLLLVALLGCGDDGDTGAPQPLTVSITSPTQKAYVRTSVTVQVVVDGGTATTVELLRDGATLAKLVAPYQYTWDTSLMAEGTYVLTARATRRGDSAVSGPLEVVVDRTPPTIESRHPSGATEWDGAISFTASEPLAASSMNDASVRLLEDGVAIRKKLQLSDEGRTVRVTVNQPLTLPSSMSLQLLPLVTDLAGNSLGDTVGAWAWEAPQWRLLGRTPVLPGHGASPMVTSLVMDAEGQPIVSFEEVDDVPVGQPDSARVAVSRWNGGGWDRIPLAGPHGQGQLAVDGAGRLYLAWGTAQFLTVNRWEGSEWSRLAHPINRYADDVDRAMRLVITPDGAPMVTWQSEQKTPYRGKAVGYTVKDGKLRTEFSLEPARLHDLEWSPSGARWMIYTEKLDTRITRVEAWNGESSKWVGFPVDDAGTTGSALAADLGFDAAGRAYLAWRHEERLFLQRWNGTRWELLGSRETPGRFILDETLALKVTPEGNAYIAWTYRPVTEGAELRLESWNGTSLEPVLKGLPSDPFGGVSLALDSAGRPVVAWVAPAPPGSYRSTIEVRANH